MARTLVLEEGRPISARPAFRGFVALDLLALVALLAFALQGALRGTLAPTWFAWALAAYALLAAGVGARALGLWAGALVWRRRLALLLVLAVLWRGSPLATWPWQVAAVLHTAALWIALLLEGRRLARAVADATGEEVYRPDPTRRPE